MKGWVGQRSMKIVLWTRSGSFSPPLLAFQATGLSSFHGLILTVVFSKLELVNWKKERPWGLMELWLLNSWCYFGKRPSHTTPGKDEFESMKSDTCQKVVQFLQRSTTSSISSNHFPFRNFKKMIWRHLKLFFYSVPCFYVNLVCSKIFGSRALSFN